MMGVDHVLGANRVTPVQSDMRPHWVQTSVAQQLGLTDGQVVQAVAEVRNNRVRLWLRDFFFELPNGWILKDGDKPFLRATSTAAGWGFLIQPGAATPDTPRTDTKPGVSGGLLPEVSTGLTLPPNASRLAALSFQPAGFGALLDLLNPLVLQAWPRATELGQWLAKWNAQRQSMAQINPSSLKRAVLQQGVSAEKKLSQGLSVSDDPKTLLKGMLAALADMETSAELEKATRDIHAALDEVEAAQVQTVQQQLRGELSLHVVIPFKDADPVELHFQRPPRQSGQEEPPLSVDIHSRSRVLGEVWLNTTIRGGHSVDLVMWAVREEVAQLAKTNASELSYELSVSGLRLNSFQIYNAPRPTDQAQSPAAHLGSVVDAQA